MTTSPVPKSAFWRRFARITTMVLAVCLLFGALPGHARADDLTDKRDRVRRNIAATQTKVNNASQNLTGATARLIESRRQLANAQAQLRYVRQQLAAAQQKDREMAGKLVVAQKALAKAKADVIRGEKNVKAQQLVIGQAVRTAYQQQTDLAGLGVIMAGEDSSNLANRIQWNVTVFETSSAKMDRLQELQIQLENAKARRAKAEKVAAENKAASERQVGIVRGLEAQAAALEGRLGGLVSQNAINESAAKQQLASHQRSLAEFQSEDARLGRQIAARIAAQKLAAARKAAAEKAAREKAAREKAARSRPSSRSGGSSGSNKSYTPRRSSSAAFVYPSSGWVSSPFGMRYDPINGSLSFHSGTDFAAGCGSRLIATRSGRVTDRYYQSSYGNRLVIDHGRVDGSYISSAYNHASYYIVSVGQRVRQGQTVGYVGTTGRSTGCHLHFQIYENGSLANPMRFL